MVIALPPTRTTIVLKLSAATVFMRSIIRIQKDKESLSPLPDHEQFQEYIHFHQDKYTSDDDHGICLIRDLLNSFYIFSVTV